MAILLSLGAQKSRIYISISTELMVIGTLASLLAIILSQILIPAFPIIFKGLAPAHVRTHTDGFTLMVCLFMGMAGSLIFCLPLFIRIFRINPLMLLRDIRPESSFSIRKVLVPVAGFLPIPATFFLISCQTTGSVRGGLFFTAGVVLALGLLSGMGPLFFQAAKFFSRTDSTVGKIAFRNLFRNKWSSLSCFAGIAMSAFLISLIPQVQKGLQNEISRPDGLKIPAFFLVDIQEEQKAPFLDLIKQEKADLSNLSPMVRGRILSINGQPFHQEPKAS